MKAEFTAVIESAEEGGYWAFCPEVPGANGQGETIEETKVSLAAAIKLIMADRWKKVCAGCRPTRSAIPLPLREAGGFVEALTAARMCFETRGRFAHSLWMSTLNGVVEAVPRHSEVKDLLARKIVSDLVSRTRSDAAISVCVAIADGHVQVGIEGTAAVGAGRRGRICNQRLQDALGSGGALPSSISFAAVG